MDLELAFWMLFFVGGYLVILAYLLRVALRQHGADGGGAPDERAPSGPDASRT